MKHGLVKSAHPAEAAAVVVTEVLVAMAGVVVAEGTGTVVNFPPTLSRPPFRTPDGGSFILTSPRRRFIQIFRDLKSVADPG
jgi:hypothetical protein